MTSIGQSLNSAPCSGTGSEPRPARVRSLYDLQEFLARIYKMLRNDGGDDLASVMDQLIAAIADMRASSGVDGWKTAVDKIRRHPITSLLHEDPFTHRGFHKPRGYAGDAPMLDFVYLNQSRCTLTEGVSALGAKIFGYTTTSPIAEAIVNRRSIMALQIDEVAERTHDAEVLALQCGHLREAELSSAMRDGKIRRFVALDRDIRAVAAVEKEWGRAGVSAINTPTYALLNGAPNALGRFDLIYSDGLFNELDVRSGVRAIASMFAMLKPDGKLWIGNFLPGIRDAAYLEAFMNWWLVYRSTAALEGLLAEIPARAIARQRTYIEPTDQIGFLEVIRSQ